MEEVEGLFESQAMLMALALLFSLCTNLIASRSGFYTFPPGSPAQPYPLSLQRLLIIFFGYFFLQSLIVPLVVYGLQAYFAGEGFQIHLPISENQQVWINIASMFVSAPVIWLLGRFLEPNLFHSIVQERGEKYPFRLALSNFLFGAKTWLVAFPLSLALGLMMEWIVNILFHPSEFHQLAVQNFKSSFNHPVQFWLTFLGIVLAVPAVEEFVFRGFVQTWLKQRVGVFPAIMGASILFASFHMTAAQGWHNLEILPSLFLLSYYLGFVFERQRSLWASIGLHATFNFVSVCLIVLQQTKGE